MTRKIEPREEPLKILFYGIPGSTKTRTSATACNDPRTAPVLYLEAGGNPIALRDYENQPDIFHIESLEDFNPFYEWLSVGQPECKFSKDWGLKPRYRTLMIDQITDIQRITMNKASGNMTTALTPGTIPNPMQRQHFGATLAHMIKFATLFYGLSDIHVIITSQEKADQDEQTGLITYGPLLWGQSATEFGGYAYMVARLVHRSRILQVDAKTKVAIGEMPENVTSVALLQPSGKYIAKDQYGMRGEDGELLPFMVDPSIPKMLDLIYGPGRGPDVVPMG